MTKKYDLEDRLISFSIQILNMSENLKSSYPEIYLKKQIIRSSLSPALNYAEAQGAESRADFIHKMKLCLKELREAQVRFINFKRKPFLNDDIIYSSLQECGELVAIFTNSIKTLKEKI